MESIDRSKRGAPLSGAHSIKAAAPENGFWHLGDFSRAYRELFGELPSRTRPCAMRGDDPHLPQK
jgi:AraC-like DNA-binding protein